MSRMETIMICMYFSFRAFARLEKWGLTCRFFGRIGRRAAIGQVLQMVALAGRHSGKSHSRRGVGVSV